MHHARRDGGMGFAIADKPVLSFDGDEHGGTIGGVDAAVESTREWMVLIFMFRSNSYNRRKENVLLRDMLFCICNGLCRRAYRPVRVRLGRQNQVQLL